MDSDSDVVFFYVIPKYDNLFHLKYVFYIFNFFFYQFFTNHISVFI